MPRRLMSRRGNSASHSQVTPYQQIELDDGWREWENIKQELVLVKRQLVEKDALILQLKTATRRLEETLRKKEKDLQAAFAILRSPQDAKTTKTRKQQLVDRLVSECLQRAATSEALAEERRQELDRLKYSSKFLRFQELEIEIEECHTEIERLRAKLETTSPSSPTAIIGKLKVSSVPLTPKSTRVFSGTMTKKTKLDPLGMPEHINSDNKQKVTISNATRVSLTQTATGQVRVVPLVKYQQREGFVSRTRRRALEAEYYKQVRLAQLEVECELEENLHIRAAREAKRLEAIEHHTRKEYVIDSAISQHPTTENTQRVNDLSNTGAEENRPSNDHDYLKQIDVAPVKPRQDQQNSENEEKSDDTTDTKIGATVRIDQTAEITEQVESVQSASEGSVKKQVATTNETNRDGHEASEGIQVAQKTYEDDDILDDNPKEPRPEGEYNVWNLDPNSQNDPESGSFKGEYAELNHRTDNNDDDNPKSAIWNADPNPTAPPEADIPIEAEADRVVWNATPHRGGPDEPVDDVSAVNSDEEDHAVEFDREEDGLNDNTKAKGLAGEFNVWNVDPFPRSDHQSDRIESKSTGFNQQTTNDSEANGERVVWNADPHVGGSDALRDDANSDEENLAPDDSMKQDDSIPNDNIIASNVWNVDPNPIPADAKLADAVALYEVEVKESVQDGEPKILEDSTERNVWNLNPIPSSDPAQAAITTDACDDEHSAAVDQPVWNLHVDPEPVTDEYRAGYYSDENAIVDPKPTAPEKENDETPWNLVPTAGASLMERNDENGELVLNADKPVEGIAVSDKLSAHGEYQDHEAADTDAEANNAWNLQRTVSTAVLESAADSPNGEKGIEDNISNLNPHNGDASDPRETANEAVDPELAQGDEGPPISQTVGIEFPVDSIDRLEIGMEDPTSLYQEVPDGSSNDPKILERTEHISDASYHGSPRESEDDATPEYTPPSTARDSDAGDD